MALKVKEITATAKATLNLGDYSNVVFEVTMTGETDGDQPGHDAFILNELVRGELIRQVCDATENRLIAGIPALNGKVGNQRRAALESQPCTKVLATLNPELAKEVVDRVLEMSLAPEKKETPEVKPGLLDMTKHTAAGIRDRKVPFQTTPKKNREQWTNADNHPMNDFGDGHPDDYGDN